MFEMRSSTSAVRAFPVGLSNDSGCHHKIQAKDCFFFFFFERQLTSTPLSTIILAYTQCLPKQAMLFHAWIPYHVLFLLLGMLFLECCPLEKSYPPNVDPFLLCHQIPGIASKYVLTTLNYNDLLGFHSLNCKFLDGN